MSRNELFIRVIGALFLILILYGIGMTVVILSGNNDVLGSRLVQGFATMFAGILGFSSGYLLAYRNGNGNGHEAKIEEGVGEHIKEEVERMNSPDEG